MKFPKQTLALIYGLFGLFLGAAFVSHVKAAEAESNEAVGYLTKEIRKIKGPKRMIAVGEFGAVGSFLKVYGDWDVGGGLAAMLSSALAESEQFIVVDRSRINDILTEQKLAANQLTQTGTGAQMGQITGAQMYIYGTVTEFDSKEKGGGFSIGLSRKGRQGSVGRQKSKSTIAFDLTLVDTTTSQIVDTFTAKKSVTAKGFDIGVGYKGIALGGDQFIKTPLGEATREAITEAVRQIARKAAESKWSGQVVVHEDGLLYINAGSSSGIQVGDRFLVRTVARMFTDPKTDRVLSIRWSDLGEVLVEHTDPELAWGNYYAISKKVPRRGDTVIPAD